MHASPSSTFGAMLDRQAPGHLRASLRTASGREVVLAHRQAPAHEFVNPGTADLVVMAVPDYRLTQALFDLGAGLRDHFCPDPRPIHLLPAETAYRWTVNGPSVTVMLAVPLAEASAILDEIDCDRPMPAMQRLMARGFVDPVVHEVIMRLWAQARLNGTCPPLLLQSWLVTALHALATRAATRPPATPRAGASLSGARLRAVLDLIEDRLADDLSLDDMAAAACASRFHFLRLFRASTGHTPYRYLLERRMERARTLLATTRLPVAEIALRVAFADPSHFSRTFARHVGMTPVAYRRTPR